MNHHNNCPQCYIADLRGNCREPEKNTFLSEKEENVSENERGTNLEFQAIVAMEKRGKDICNKWPVLQTAGHHTEKVKQGHIPAGFAL